MKTRMFFSYAACGAALGGASGIAAAGAVWVGLGYMWVALTLAVLAGMIMSAGGALASRVPRAALYDCATGALLGGGGYLLGIGIYTRTQTGGASNSTALVSVLFVLLYSYAMGISHTTSLGHRGARLPAAFFAGIGGLLALAVDVRILWPARDIAASAAIAAGAVFGGMLWGGVGAARKIFGIDVDRFRVRHAGR